MQHNFENIQRPNQNSLNQALFRAVKRNDTEGVISLLKLGAKPTLIEERTKNSCLHLAVMHDNPEMVEILLQYKASITVLNKNKLTPIQKINRSTWICLPPFLKFSNDVNGQANFGHILVDAIERNLDLTLIKGLLEKGAGRNWFTANKNVFDWAIHHDNVPVIRLLIKYSDPCYLDNKTFKGKKKSIIFAIDQWQLNCVVALAEGVKSRAELGDALIHLLDTSYKTNKEVPLDVVAFLLRHNATLNFKNATTTALHLAISLKNPVLISLLLSYGANPNLNNDAQHDALSWADKLKFDECRDAICQPENYKYKPVDAQRVGWMLLSNLHLRGLPLEITQAILEYAFKSYGPNFYDLNWINNRKTFSATQVFINQYLNRSLFKNAYPQSGSSLKFAHRLRQIVNEENALISTKVVEINKEILKFTATKSNTKKSRAIDLLQKFNLYKKQPMDREGDEDFVMLSRPSSSK